MIIVTGGAGFIGSNIIKGLNQMGFEDILVVDRLGSSDKYRNLTDLKFNNYLNKDRFRQMLRENRLAHEDIQVVFHQGACSNTMEMDGDYMMDNNLSYSVELLDFCLERRIPFIYASSAAVYGSGRMGFREERSCEGPLNPYGLSKLIFDNHVRSRLKSASSPVVGLRYFNVFGPNEFHKGKMASVAYHFYNQLTATGKARLFKGTDGYGHGEQRRDFVYVKDVVRVNLWFWTNGGPSGIYNCGTGTSRTFNHVAQGLIRVLGRGEVQYVDFPDSLRGRYQNHTEADLTRLREAGCPHRFTPLEEALEDYCRFLAENQDRAGA
ncbi:ADP-L-glycero-D-manno-heptose-6-epimerase [Thermanaerovibrio velox DSM 12556]|uniref:ADP-L-glycero-D-manno-heptose-6-epimerase n=1 Tax=Thermanaerovibrio velox DSM 12556 TaxID=926567 RepID=H0UN29_9BACT|nr:ADP-glyceromanno-heptose 6-epimerase [Thermanaerovibrio velox]EHM09308.1 ADP-L-glycero-D-manno-heptose-6-epimerase [Thermanaerovibrio velox DSM 12556]